MAVCLTVYAIFSVKVSRDLENWVRGCSRSLKMAPFDRACTTFYWCAIVNYSSILYRFELFDVEMTLKSPLEVTQGHSNWYHSKAWVQFSIRIP